MTMEVDGIVGIVYLHVLVRGGRIFPLRVTVAWRGWMVMLNILLPTKHDGWVDIEMHRSRSAPNSEHI